MRFRPLWFAILLVFLCGAKKPEMVPIGSIPGSTVALDYIDQVHLDGSGESASIEVGATGTPASYIGLEGYKVRVTFKNNSNKIVILRPKFYLYDGKKAIIGFSDLRFFVTEAARISGSPVPSSFSVPNSGYNRTFGILNDPSTGRSYYYSGYSGAPPSFGSGFAQGYALGQAMKEARRRENASRALSWAGSSWVKEEYEIPPGVTVSGELFFASMLAQRVGRKTTPEPISLKVYFWDETFRHPLESAVVQMPPLGR